MLKKKMVYRATTKNTFQESKINTFLGVTKLSLKGSPAKLTDPFSRPRLIPSGWHSFFASPYPLFSFPCPVTLSWKAFFLAKKEGESSSSSHKACGQHNLLAEEWKIVIWMLLVREFKYSLLGGIVSVKNACELIC